MFRQNLSADGIFFEEPYLNRKSHPKTTLLNPLLTAFYGAFFLACFLVFCLAENDYIAKPRRQIDPFLSGERVMRSIFPTLLICKLFRNFPSNTRAPFSGNKVCFIYFLKTIDKY